MIADFFSTAEALVGDLASLYFPLGADALTLEDLTSYLVVGPEAEVVDPVATLGLTLEQVGTSRSYRLHMVPQAPGTYLVRAVFSGLTFECYLTATDPDEVADAATFGDYTLTLKAGAAAVPNGLVSVYDVAGISLVQRGTTDSSGSITFYGLPVGNYQVRAYAPGVNLQDVNPTTISVTPNAQTMPRIQEVLPTTATEGDVLAISGHLFSPETSQVTFGASTTVSPIAVNSAGTLLLVEVPAGLTDTIVPIRVSKEDPSNLPLGRLTSQPAYLVRT